MKRSPLFKFSASIVLFTAGILASAQTDTARIQGRITDSQGVQAAMKLRHDHSALQSGDLKEALINDSIFAFTRTSKDGADSLLILLNSSNQDQPVSLTNAADGALPHATSLTEIFAMQPGPANQVNFSDGIANFTTRAQSLTIYTVHTQ